MGNAFRNLAYVDWFECNHLLQYNRQEDPKGLLMDSYFKNPNFQTLKSW